MVSQINAVIAAGAAGHVNLPARQRINIKTHCADFMAEDFSKLCNAGFLRLPLVILVRRSSRLIISVSWSAS